MSWQETIVIVAGIFGAVLTLRLALPFVKPRDLDERQSAALVDVNKRLAAVEGHLMDRQGRLPTSIGRRGA